MLLTISTTAPPATDLGYLLHKHPGRLQTFALAFGRAHAFYPEAGEDRCTAALLLEIDPIGMVRGRHPGASQDQQLAQYVNDRPYVASSFMSVAIGEVYGSALGGRSRERQALADQALPFEARLAVVPCRGGEPLLRRVFEPLGYDVRATPHALDECFPEWGESRYVTVELRGICRLKELLGHLYVLIPVLDGHKHYFVGDDEVEKLLRHGEGWLSAHPERELIVGRYLKRRRSLVRDALDRLAEGDSGESEDEAVLPVDDAATDEDRAAHASMHLGVRRIAAVVAALKQAGAKRVLDLGCGEGRLVRALLEDGSFEQIVGLDASHRSLERASARLRLDRRPARQAERVQLLHGALTYRDARLAGFDAAAAVEVVEHLDPGRLVAFERVLFEFARPKAVVLTTPNAEYNARFAGLDAGALRHPDHRFEWTRAELAAWAGGVAERHGYTVRYEPIGPEDPDLGPPTQLAVFVR